MFDQMIDFFNMHENAIWVFQVFLLIFITLVLGHLVSRVINRLQQKFKETRNIWDDALAVSIRRPAKTMVWVIGITLAIELVDVHSDQEFLGVVYPIRDVAVIAIICWFVNRFIREVKQSFVDHKQAKGEEVDYTTVDALAKLLRAAVLITAALITLQTLGFSISGVLAFGGVGGLAIGFAAKDLLANFFGALMIYFDRPFKVGDWIRSPDKEIEGTVEEIGWRQTRIRTFDKRPLYVPNSLFSTIAVENPSRMSHRRIYETIGVRYDDVAKLDKIVANVKKMLEEHPEIDSSQTLIVNVNAFAPSSVDFFVYTFTKTTNWIKFHEIKQDVLLRINQIIDQQDAQIAFPTSTLSVPEGIVIKGGKAA